MKGKKLGGREVTEREFLLMKVSEIEELQEIHDFLNDDDWVEAMDMVLNCIANPYVPREKVGALIVKLESYGSLFNQKAKKYMYLKDNSDDNKEASKRKNLYMSISEDCHDVAAALKYIAK